MWGPAKGDWGEYGASLHQWGEKASPCSWSWSFLSWTWPCFSSPTGALKSYLRELPEPLMTTELYDEWIQASKWVSIIEDSSKSLYSREYKSRNCFSFFVKYSRYGQETTSTYGSVWKASYRQPEQFQVRYPFLSLWMDGWRDGWSFSTKIKEWFRPLSIKIYINTHFSLPRSKLSWSHVAKHILKTFSNQELWFGTDAWMASLRIVRTRLRQMDPYAEGFINKQR